LKVPENVKATEIEFLEKSNAEETLESKSRIIKVDEMRFETSLSAWEKYFRVRSIHQTGVRGAWSEIRPVDDFLKKAYREPKLSFVQSGTTEYLVGNQVKLIAQGEMAIQYKLNDEAIRTYSEPITLNKEAGYDLEVTMENSDHVIVYRKLYHFRTDLTAPKTQRIITAPTYINNHARLSADSRLEIRGNDNASGVKSSFYRCIPLSVDFEIKPFSTYKSPLSRNDLIGEKKDIEMCLLQYYSIDNSGNTEKISTELLYLE